MKENARTTNTNEFDLGFGTYASRAAAIVAAAPADASLAAAPEQARPEPPASVTELDFGGSKFAYSVAASAGKAAAAAERAVKATTRAASSSNAWKKLVAAASAFALWFVGAREWASRESAALWLAALRALIFASALVAAWDRSPSKVFTFVAFYAFFSAADKLGWLDLAEDDDGEDAGGVLSDGAPDDERAGSAERTRSDRDGAGSVF